MMHDMNYYYYLKKEDKVIICESIYKYTECIKLFGADQHVDGTVLTVCNVEYLISTVCLMINHDLITINNPPLIFETMVFVDGGMAYDAFQQRYRSLEKARSGHNQAVKLVMEMEEELKLGENITNIE